MERGARGRWRLNRDDNKQFGPIRTDSKQLDEFAVEAADKLPAYRDRVARLAETTPLVTLEGSLQTALASPSDRCFLFDRESIVSFKTRALRAEQKKRLLRPMLDALRSVDGVPGRPRSIGDKLDGLAVDSHKRLLVIEAKHGKAGHPLSWTPAQVGVYATLFTEWIDDDREYAHKVLTGMIQQRHSLLGLEASPPVLGEELKVVPVIATTPVVNQPEEVNCRMEHVAAAAARTCAALERLEVWQVDPDGRIDPVGLGNLR